MEHLIEVLVALAVAALGVYLKARHNIDVNRRVQEILDRAALVGIGVAEEKGHSNGLKGAAKESIAVEAAKVEALADAAGAGKSVVKRVAAVVGQQAGGVVVGLVKAKLGLSRLRL